MEALVIRRLLIRGLLPVQVVLVPVTKYIRQNSHGFVCANFEETELFTVFTTL